MVLNILLSVDFDVGIIVGRILMNLVYFVLIEGVDDGKVLVEFIKLDGMFDYIVLLVSYMFMMNSLFVIL